MPFFTAKKNPSEGSYPRRRSPYVELRLRTRISALQWLDIELTERCNNNCIHCFINLPVNDPEAQRRELSSAQIREIIRDAAQQGCLGIRFTGGEPLLREDFEEIYLYARSLRLKVSLFTNATLLSPRRVGMLRHVPPLEAVEVTVYGMKKESYERVSRRSGSFETAWGGINRLLQARVPFLVRGFFPQPGPGEVAQFESWARTIPWMDGIPPRVMFLDLRSRRDPKKSGQIKRLRAKPEEVLKILTRRRDAYFQGMTVFCSHWLAPPGDRLFSCGAGKGRGCLDAYGYLHPCILLKDPSTSYDLKAGNLREGLAHIAIKAREMKASNLDYLGRCARCFLRGLCEQCPAKSWTEHGTLDTPVEYACQIAHAQARFLGLLNKREKSWEISDGRGRISILSREKNGAVDRRKPGTFASS